MFNVFLTTVKTTLQNISDIYHEKIIITNLQHQWPIIHKNSIRLTVGNNFIDSNILHTRQKQTSQLYPPFFCGLTTTIVQSIIIRILLLTSVASDELFFVFWVFDYYYYYFNVFLFFLTFEFSSQIGRYHPLQKETK